MTVEGGGRAGVGGSRPAATAARSSGGRCIMTQHRDLFAALAAPFEPEEVKLRAQGSRQLHYVTARTVMNRLDDVLGPENWWDDFVPLEHSVICRLTVRLPDGQILTKSDAGGYAGMADPGDDDKSGFADAFKRAAVKFGVGRYLYRDGVPRFAREALRGRPEAEAVAPSPTAEPAPTAQAPASNATPRPAEDGPSAPERPGALRLDEGSGREARVRPAQAPERLGQAAGVPRADGRTGRGSRSAGRTRRLAGRSGPSRTCSTRPRRRCQIEPASCPLQRRMTTK